MKKGKDGGFSEKQAARAADGRLHEPASCGGQLRRRAEGGEGPLRKWFDYISDDSYFGQSSWEKAESVMLSKCFALCCDKARIPPSDIQYLVRRRPAQPVRRLNVRRARSPIPYFGVYGACSTMAEESVARRDDDRRRIRRHRVRHDELTLLLGGAAVSAPA